MAAKKGTTKKKITINRKKKDEVVEEVKTVEEKVEETPVVEETTPVTTVVENEISDGEKVGWTRSQLKGEIVGNGTSTVVKQPKGRIRFEAQASTVPMFKLPEDIRRYLVSNGLPTSVWKWDKERLEKRGVDMNIVEKLKEFLSSMDI